MANYPIPTKRVQLHLNSPQNAGSTLAIGEVYLRTASGGANVATTLANASCSANGSNPSNAIDISTTSLFTASGQDAWWGYTFASAVAITEIAITAPNTANYAQAPKNLAAYVTDSNGKRVQAFIATNLTWSQGETKVFVINDQVGIEKQAKIYTLRRARTKATEVVVTPPPPAGTTLIPMFSTSTAKTSPQALNGSSVSGNVYIFIPDDPLLSKVEFWVDSAAPSNPTEPVFHTENLAPWDLMGADAGGLPVAFNTAPMSNGSHTISIRITYNGQVQPIYYISYTVNNAVVDTISWKSGYNLGTQTASNHFAGFDAWRGRPSNTSTVNALMYTLNELALGPSGSYGFRWWKSSINNYVDYWTEMSWLPSDMLLNIQVSPMGGKIPWFQPGARDGNFIIVPSIQADADAEMMNQVNGNNYSKWYSIGVSHASRNRNGNNTMLTLGHEFNGTWYPHSPKNIGDANWITMFRNAVTAYRAGYYSVLPNGNPPKIGWCYGDNKDPAKGGNYSTNNVWNCYPGDAYVDVINVHHYDFTLWDNGATQMSSWTQTSPWNNSLAEAINYCVSKKPNGPKFYCGEWDIVNALDKGDSQRLSPGQDSTTFIQMMYDMFQYCASHGLMLGESLFQGNNGTSGETKYIYPTVTSGNSKNVNAGNLYKSLWTQ